MLHLQKHTNGNTDILISRNHSASWRQTVYMLILISTTILLISLYWLWRGAWVVIPFAGFEIIVLTIISYKVSKRSFERELLQFYDGVVHLSDTKGNGYTFYKSATRLDAIKPQHSLSQDRLFLSDGIQQIPVGVGLNKEDTDTLKRYVETLGLKINNIGYVRKTALNTFDHL